MAASEWVFKWSNEGITERLTVHVDHGLVRVQADWWDDTDLGHGTDVCVPKRAARELAEWLLEELER